MIITRHNKTFYTWEKLKKKTKKSTEEKIKQRREIY